MAKKLLYLKNLIDRLPYWYGSLDETTQSSVVAISFVLGVSLGFGLLMPSWANASTDCGVVSFSELTEDQVYTMEVCANLAFKGSAGEYARNGPLATYSFLSYRIGWCVYHEMHPSASLHQYHDWLKCRNQGRGLEYFF